jgi:hypothetical protein
MNRMKVREMKRRMCLLLDVNLLSLENRQLRNDPTAPGSGSNQVLRLSGKRRTDNQSDDNGGKK